MYFQSSPNGLFNKLTKPKKKIWEKRCKITRKLYALKENELKKEQKKDTNQCYEPPCPYRACEKNIRKKGKKHTETMALRKTASR